MRFNKLDLNLLVALDALLSEQNISRAAEKIHLSQSATSNALARLREYFDDELLVQVGRKMEPTPRAEALKDAVRDILVRVDATVTAQPEFVPAQACRLFRLFVSDYTMTTLIPHLFRLAYAQAPGIGFDLRPQVAYPHRVLERGEADLLIIPKEYCSTEHPAEVLLEETFCCVLWEHSPLAKGELTKERYMGAGHIVVQVGEGQTALEAWFMQRLGVVRRVEASTYSFLSPAHLLVGTNRIATMHRRLAEAAARDLPLVLRDVPLTVPTMEQSVQWHKHRTSDQGLMWLRALLKEAVAAMDRARLGDS
ncbi:LysR family transcriptional regulator [Burkholderia vietnamiensis]|uniref:LysR family transcriptional regulator n=1 Tax=Burkholderia vietnamiensis TaxID=60552 RepID=UPI001594E352|nr:LysR family transcriptional regulator [Burkholderia vietnamiensis]MCA7944986.1 LysR family transcriptional regulator [Burkholderia vietnamiensis]HDR8971897.1 LysR family transcriptional regulator [Burkholderia vietnamiensis]HDR9145611.1 LysR family transcriptional regulator [Burkholderia vietnamiensis]HDR9221355.1 LysR family transcriptional regulator [Burkholderia vietnamiensis]